MHDSLSLEIIPKHQLSETENSEIIALCSLAFDEAFKPYLETFDDSIHIMARLEMKLVSHALWITRWLQVEDGALMRTAYVEGVATEESCRGRGYASAVMTRLAQEIAGVELGGLSPAETTLYTRLGWEYWQGALFHRKDGRLIPDPPDERLMILRLMNTPDLDLFKPISVEWREGEVW